MPFLIDDILLMAALGAGAGALTNKKDPLKGALMGGALGGVGGAVVPGLLSAGGATAGIAPGATAAAEGGLLAGGEQAAMLAAQEAGLGATGSLGWGGATTGLQGGMNSMFGADAGMQAGGLLGQAGSVMDKAKPVMQAAQTGQQMASATDQPQLPAPAAPMIRSSPPDLNGILQQGYQEQKYLMDDAERRRRLMQQYAQNMGGY
jgi:hypothetical protein